MFSRETFVGAAGRLRRRVQPGHITAWRDGTSGDAIGLLEHLIARLARAADSVLALAFGFQRFVVDQIAEGVFRRALGALSNGRCFLGEGIIFFTFVFHSGLQSLLCNSCSPISRSVITAAAAREEVGRPRWRSAASSGQ